jgi:hypothetical protein
MASTSASDVHGRVEMGGACNRTESKEAHKRVTVMIGDAPCTRNDSDVTARAGICRQKQTILTLK